MQRAKTNIKSEEPETGRPQNIATDVYQRLGLKTEMAKAYVEEALKLAVLFDKKQQDYGSGNIARFGEMGVVVRANDKLERLRNLLFINKDKAPNNESVEDTWSDLHVYGVIGLLCHKGRWQ